MHIQARPTMLKHLSSTLLEHSVMPMSMVGYLIICDCTIREFQLKYYLYKLGECMALWGEPSVVIGCICATQSADVLPFHSLSVITAMDCYSLTTML